MKINTGSLRKQEISPMAIKIKRVDEGLPMPEYATGGSWGLDLTSRISVELEPGDDEIIPLNVIVEAPPGFGMFLYPRSSIYKHFGLIMLNSVGVIDGDYNGPEDEIGAHIKNMSDSKVIIKRGDRIAQLVPHRVFQMPVVEFEPGGASRGGHGTTGKN